MIEKEVVKLTKEGMSIRSISKKLNIKRKEVESIIKEYSEKFKPVQSVINYDFSDNKLLSDIYAHLTNIELEKGNFKIVDEIDGRLVVVKKDFDYDEKTKRNLVSLYQAYNIHKTAYPWIKKLDRKEIDIVEERLTFSVKYYEDSQNLNKLANIRMNSLTIACETLVEIIAKLITRCVKNGDKLHSSFYSKHSIKLRWEVQQEIFVLFIRKRGTSYNNKLKCEPLGDSPKNMLKILEKEGLSQELVREKVFTNARYMSDKKLVKYLNDHYLPTLKRDYNLILAIMKRILEDLPLAIGEDRENGDILIGLQILNNDDCKQNNK